MADANQEAESEIHFNRAFVELIKDNGPNAFKRDIVEQAAEEDAGRGDDESRIAADLGIEAHVVANFAADFAATQMGNAASNGASGEPARLHEDEFLVAWQVIENGGRNEHRLAGAGWSRNDGGPGARGGDRFS